MLTITDISQAAVGGLEDSVGAYKCKHMWILNVKSHQFWFLSFMTGIHKRVGQVRKPNKELPINVLHAADMVLEEQWAGVWTAAQKKRITEMGSWFFLGFCMGLQGEEILQIELASTANSLCHLDNKVDAHFQFIVLGRTKDDKLSGAKFGVPCVPVAARTNLQSGHWVKRLVDNMHSRGKRSGHLFSRMLATPKMHDFKDDFSPFSRRCRPGQN
jgi:hypothetical protein